MATGCLGSDDATVKLWRTNGTLAHTLAASGLIQVTALAFAPAAPNIAAGYGDGSIRLWNTSNGSLARTFNLVWNSNNTNNLGKIASLSFSPDASTWLLVAGFVHSNLEGSDGTMTQACEEYRTGPKRGLLAGRHDAGPGQ